MAFRPTMKYEVSTKVAKEGDGGGGRGGASGSGSKTDGAGLYHSIVQQKPASYRDGHVPAAQNIASSPGGGV